MHGPPAATRPGGDDSAMHETEEPTRLRRRLPFTLYVLAGLLLLKAVLLFAVVGGATMQVALRPLLGFTTAPELLQLISEAAGAEAVLLVFAGILVLSVVGMLGRRRIGWLLAMVVTGLFVAVDIYSFANNGANHLWMGLNIVTVFYLNQQDVREAVGAAVSRTDELPKGAA
jgi:hypothetical protein